MANKLRNIVLMVRDPSATARLFKDALGISIRHQTSNMIELDSGVLPIIIKEGNNAATLCMGYSPMLTFDVGNMDHSITTALGHGAMLDGPIRYPAYGKVRQPVK